MKNKIVVENYEFIIELITNGFKENLLKIYYFIIEDTH